MPPSWLELNLGPRHFLAPNCYTLRHGAASDMVPLRNWVLEASDAQGVHPLGVVGVLYAIVTLHKAFDA